MALSIKITDLAKRFGPRVVFKRISLRVEQGRALTVVGPNGSGKTTFLLTLLGIHRADKGEVEFCDSNGASIDSESRREHCGLVAPYLNLYDSLTAEENLIFFANVAGRHLQGKEISELLGRVGLEGRGGDLVAGYSSGMKQRLKYAVAISGQPDFLFLDEPTSNLDETGKSVVFGVIDEFRARSIVVLATNEPEEEKLGDLECRLDG